MNILAPFDGISCGMVAAQRAGINVERYVAFEIDENAIKVSSENYPDIERNGDVFDADFTRFKGFELLMGGSPCTYWSTAQHKGRETTPSGKGFELFMQFVRAKEESECRYFLYENNRSISPKIKKEISKCLGVNPITLNSALVSAQERWRCYWTNIPVVGFPEDKGIVLRDVVKKDHEFRDVGKWVYKEYNGKTKLESLKKLYSAEKSSTLTTSRYHAINYYLDETGEKYTNLDAEEWEKLQTLPSGYTKSLKGDARHKVIGNGWTVDIIAWILSFIPEEERIK